MKKRLLSMFLVLAMAASMLMGCSTGTESSDGGSSETEEKTEKKDGYTTPGYPSFFPQNNSL